MLALCPLVGRVRAVTELARLSRIAFKVGSWKAFIKDYCRLSETLKAARMGGYWKIKPTVKNQEVRLFTSAVGHSSLSLKVARHGWA